MANYTGIKKIKIGDNTFTFAIPTKTSQIENDSGFITANAIPTSLPASDVYSWAKAASKPTYTASEVGAMSTSHAANGITAANISGWNDKTSYEYYNVKSQITPASGVTISSAYLYVWGERVAQLYIACSFSSSQTANTSYDIGTLASAIRPHNLAILGSTYGAGQITSAGVISFRPQLNLNSGNRYFSAVYMLASAYSS
jgi:hypothetical protein